MAVSKKPQKILENDNILLGKSHGDKENVKPLNATVDKSKKSNSRLNSTDGNKTATNALKNTISDLEEAQESLELMPPPMAPCFNKSSLAFDTSALHNQSQQRSRPQLAAKLKIEHCLKEPSLMSKLRRPTNNEGITVKLEHEPRASQMHLPAEDAESHSGMQTTTTSNNHTSSSTVSSEDSGVQVLTEKISSVVTIPSDDKEPIMAPPTQTDHDDHVPRTGLERVPMLKTSLAELGFQKLIHESDLSISVY